MRARVLSLLGLKPAEVRRTALAGAFHFLFVASVVLVKSASNAAVLSRYAASALPPLYVATALATGLAAWTAARLLRHRQARLPDAALVLSALVLGALALATWRGFTVAVTALYLFGEVFATLVSIRFWTAASELFDAREGRRVFGVLGGAGMAGAIVAGFATQLLGHVVGALGLLPLSMGAMVACAGVGRLVRPEAAGASRRQAQPTRLSTVVQGSYPRALATTMLLLAALTAVADFFFRRRAGELLGEDDLASFFGSLNLWTGVVAVLFQLAASGRVLERFGVFRYLLVTPTLSALAAVGCVFLPGLAPVFALRLVESAGSLSLNPSAFQLLYGPLPDDVRAQVRAGIDGLVKKTGFALGGILLLPLSGSSEAVLALLVVVIAAILVMLLRRSQPLYVSAIEARLARPARGTVGWRSAEARSVLEGSLAAAEPVRVLTSLALLRDDPRFDPVPHLPALLGHADERVRIAAVRLVSERRSVRAVPALERLLAEGGGHELEEAILALGQIAPDHAREILRPATMAPDPGISGAALAALIRIDGESGSAGRALQKRLDEAKLSAPEVRRETARLLGWLGGTRFAPRLEGFLRDPSPAVKRAAAEAAAQVKDLGLARDLLVLLGDRHARSAARHALAALGDAVVPRLEALLNDRSSRISIRLEVPRVLRDIGTAEAARALLFSNIQDDAYLRYRIALALSRIREEHPEVKVDPKRLREATLRRLRAYRRYVPVYRDLEATLPPASLLLRALDDRLEQNLEVVFRLLQLEHGGSALIDAWRTFASGNARERAYAIELTEHLVDPDMRRMLVPALERYHRLPEAWGGVPAVPERAPRRLLELLRARDAVVRGCAYLTARRSLPGFEEAFSAGAPEGAYVDEAVLERVFFLEGVEILAQCEVDDLVALATIARNRTYRMGETIFPEGGPGDALYVILEGRVRFTKGESEVISLGAREAFGETSLLDGAPRPIAALADATTVRVLHVDRQDFLELVSDRPELLKGVFAAVARHLKLVIEVAATARLSAPRGDSGGGSAAA